MNYYTPPLQPPPSAPCCSPSSAWVLVREVSWLALRGEAPLRAVAWAVDHALAMERLAKVPR